MSVISLPKKWAQRVGAILAALVLALAVLIPVQSASATSAKPAAKPTIVLVHGAWADSSSWAATATALQLAGYNVQTPPNPLRGLSSDAAYLSAYLQQRTTGPVILVGHSYGGAVITNAALSDPDVKGLVYVDAFMPDAGQSVSQIVASSKSALNVADPTSVFDFVAYPGAPTGDVDVYLKKTVFDNQFAQDIPSTLRNTLYAGQKPVTLSALSEPSGTPAWKTLPSWYVVGTADKVLPADTQLQMAARAHSKVTKVNASHLSMLSHPLTVVKVITDAAKSAR